MCFSFFSFHNFDMRYDAKHLDAITEYNTIIIKAPKNVYLQICKCPKSGFLCVYIEQTQRASNAHLIDPTHRDWLPISLRPFTEFRAAQTMV